MNNIAAGAIGGVAVLTVAASAMLFANYRGSADEADGAAPQEVATKTVGSAPTRISQLRTVCSEERVVTKKQWGTNGVLGTVIGGAAGGVLGHQIGGGSGKDVATAVGAVGGAYAGKRIANDKYPDQEVSYKEVCREVPAS